MALTMRPPSARTAPRVRFAHMIPEVHAEGARSVVAPRGEADLSARRDLSEALCRATADGPEDVVIDLAEATFVDTAISGPWPPHNSCFIARPRSGHPFAVQAGHPGSEGVRADRSDRDRRTGATMTIGIWMVPLVLLAARSCRSGSHRGSKPTSGHDTTTPHYARWSRTTRRPMTPPPTIRRWARRGHLAAGSALPST
jgi:hypothetical protein